jgi:hypothetical protein
MKIQPTKTDKGTRIGPVNTSFGRSVYLANPSDRSWTRHRYVLWFGACGPTRVMVWANSLDDAIEIAAEWLADHAPGNLIPIWGEEHKGLIAEACSDRGVDFATFDGLDDDAKSAITTDAEADLSMTESGFLTAYEWGIDMEDPTRAQLDAFLYDPSLDWSAERAGAV